MSARLKSHASGIPEWILDLDLSVREQNSIHYSITDGYLGWIDGPDALRKCSDAALLREPGFGRLSVTHIRQALGQPPPQWRAAHLMRANVPLPRLRSLRGTLLHVVKMLDEVLESREETEHE